jgi:Flp pilus assembly protein TadB
MDVPADRSTRTAEPQPQQGVREAARQHRRRRPTGEPPPLPHHLQTSGVRWLVAMVVLVAAAAAVFARGMRGIAVDVTVADVAVVGWLSGVDLPGFKGGRCAGWSPSAPGGSCTRSPTR